MNPCKNCLEVREKHTDDGVCLFSPTRFDEMTLEEFLVHLSETYPAMTSGTRVYPLVHPNTVPLTSPSIQWISSPSVTWNNTVSNLVVPSTYTTVSGPFL